MRHRKAGVRVARARGRARLHGGGLFARRSARRCNEIAQRPLGFDEKRSFSVVFEQARNDPAQPERRRARARRSCARCPAWRPRPSSSCRRSRAASCPRHADDARRAAPGCTRCRATPSCSSALGMRPIAGRALARRTTAIAGGPTPVLVTATLAATLGPSRSARRLSSPGLGSLTVVGVLRRIRCVSVRSSPARSELVICRGRRSTRGARTISCAPRGRLGRLRARSRRPRALATRRASSRSSSSRPRASTSRATWAAPTPSSSSPCSAWCWSCWSVRSAWPRRWSSSARARSASAARSARARRTSSATSCSRTCSRPCSACCSAPACARLLDAALGPLRGALIIDWPAYSCPPRRCSWFPASSRCSCPRAAPPDRALGREPRRLDPAPPASPDRCYPPPRRHA